MSTPMSTTGKTQKSKPKSNVPPLARLPMAVTMGDTAGIGSDITVLAWQQHHTTLPPFFYVGDASHLARRARTLGLNIPIQKINAPQDTMDVFKRALPVIHMDIANPDACGEACTANAPMIIESIKSCTQYVLDGHASAMVTNPINKSVLYSAGFNHPGHTEYLAHLSTGDATDAIMMLACGHWNEGGDNSLRVVPLTTHLSLRDAIDAVTPTAITEMILRLNHECKTKLGIANPRIAVAGLNPHAGEDGAMGHEEMMIITPAIEHAREIDPTITVTHPLPPDTLFHAEARASYDIALCMYHDQALIPLKTLDFHGGVNVTLGLPMIRTSPDHGTAFSLAGTGTANPNSFINAIHHAHNMAHATAPKG